MTPVRTLEGPGPGRIRLLGHDLAITRSWSNDLEVRRDTYADAVGLPEVPGVRQLQLGGLFTADGELILASQRAKQDGLWNLKRVPGPTLAEPTTRIKGRTLFIGHHRGIFGHVLLETLPRLWSEEDLGRYDTLLCHRTTTVRRQPVLELAPYVRRLLEALGSRHATAHIVVPGQPVVLEEVTVASPAFWLKRAYSPCVRGPFDRIAQVFERADGASVGSLPRRIYFSRSRLRAGERRASNEDEIHKMMRSAGFTIIHPQTLPIADQVVLVRHADAIAGCDGSALHLAGFARAGTRLLGLDSRVVENQFMIDEFAGVDALHALVSTEPLTTRNELWRADLDVVQAALDLVE